MRLRDAAAILAMAIGAGVVTAALAQTVEGLDLQKTERRAQTSQDDAQALVDFVRGQGGPQDAAARSEAVQGVANDAYDRIADLDVSNLARVAKGAPVDLDEMVAGAKSTLAGPGTTALVMAFVSLSMPEEVLRRTICDTTRAGGIVVMRGFSAGGARAFVARLSRVVDQKDASNIAIDPRLFRAFHVDRVPTIVSAASLFAPCDQLDCATPPPPHDRITGNVPLSYALQTFAESNGPGSPAAKVALANLGRRQ